ncbi:glycosyltransferase family 4 protein [Rhodoblastus acidophilus]|uniref:Glycosyltransferase family 4 protein n=1 Tax=Candidatus Rhodoblastus alkanivorans TaxID=2954117 RepID=A0ABS9Z9N3_9HYPH|nr:glycosyltransferase family 4 protein [Candidatus Rhodoblastus alkanivorans]MCI4679827.1 glycosyltransferase family 4 protein [Candidatus Rhodoblastus alkanivorans]MCI4684333.1 glycosyltransferase family 4 protein [Candidatus Rhodoblastus alkanivorans]MDI4641654.1 glycosyltransferase family 4 protein [Rhodoblastus acidophilus]
MKVAIVHEWLVTRAGSEKVVEEILALYPEADLFTLICALPPGQDDMIRGRKVTTSFLQNLWGAHKRHRLFMPLMPLAVEQFDLSGYDLVISSSHAVAKGVITGPNQIHISYIHSPMRYAWDLQHTYLAESGLSRGFGSALARILLHYLRIWDIRTANGPERMVANSAYIARRIAKVYRREADVVFPPVDIAAMPFSAHRENFYLAASRMAPYKRMALIVSAFARMPDKKLVVIGDGPELPLVRRIATSNIEVLGYLDDAGLRDYMRRAKAFVFAAEEDFGIMPVEAQACGAPVIAFGRGGALETIVGPEGVRPTGLFFDCQSEEAIIAAVRRFDAEAARFAPENCRANAARFSREAFRAHFKAIVDEEIARAAGSLRKAA